MRGVHYQENRPSIGPWYLVWTSRSRWLGTEAEYVSDANTPGRWKPVSYRRTLLGVPVTWWRKVVPNADGKRV